MKDRKKGFYRYRSSKRKSRENRSLLQNSIGKLVTTDVEEAEILNAVFALAFIVSVQEFQVPEARGNSIGGSS